MNWPRIFFRSVRADIKPLVRIPRERVLLESTSTARTEIQFDRLGHWLGQGEFTRGIHQGDFIRNLLEVVLIEVSFCQLGFLIRLTADFDENRVSLSADHAPALVARVLNHIAES